VTINSATGVITIAATTAGGIHPFTITASNGIGSNATQSFTLTVNEAPAITSANTKTAIRGTADTFQVVATGYPSVSYSLTGAPVGVNINSASGLITIAATTTAGDHVFTITASNGIGSNATQSFTLKVTVPVTGVTLNRSTAIIYSLGGTLQLTATVIPNDATLKTVTWSSSIPAVATVNATGLVTAVSVGNTVITVKTNDGDRTAVCKVFVYINGTQVPSNDIIPEKPTLPPGTSNDIVSSDPIIIIPPNSNDISNEKDMLANILPGFSSDDFNVNKNGIMTIKDSVAEEIAKKLLSVDKVEVITIPVFEAVLNDPGDTAALSFKVKGSHLMVNGLVSKAENVRLMNIVSSDSGDWYTYAGTAGALDDKTFTILDMNGNIVSGDLDPNGDYKLVFLIKDGGSFDADWKTDGSVWGVLSLVGVPVTGITLTATNPNLSSGSSFDFSPGVGFIPPIADNKKVTWSISGDAAIATVNQNGVVTANSTGRAGSVDVIVTSVNGGYTAKYTVTVLAVPVTGVTLNKTTTTLASGASETLVATVVPANATNKNVTWSVSGDTAIATVNSSGLVTANSTGRAGSVQVIVTTQDGNRTASCTATVSSVPVTGVTLNKTTTSLSRGTSETLVASVVPSNATNKNVTWSSSASSIATVSAVGLVNGVSVGAAAITVRTQDGNYSATCNVTVLPDITGPGIVDPIFPPSIGDIPTLDPDDLEVIDGKVYLKKSLADKIAREQLKVKEVNTYILPVFQGVVPPGTDVVGIRFTVKGKNLLAQFPDDVNVIGMISAKDGLLFEYIDNLSDSGNGKFTILLNGVVFDGEIDPDTDYELVAFIKDGGNFDLDRIVNGKVTSAIFIAAEKSGKRRGGGCNADFGYLAFALLGAMPLVKRKR
jgi:uncharacterized protein YjdB